MTPHHVRGLLADQPTYEQVRAVRHRAASLLAAAGGALWIGMRGAARPGPTLGIAIFAGWACIVGTIAAGAFELLWRRRRDQAAAVLPR